VLCIASGQSGSKSPLQRNVLCGRDGGKMHHVRGIATQACASWRPILTDKRWKQYGQQAHGQLYDGIAVGQQLDDMTASKPAAQRK